jgi:hypothetical protein
MRSLRDIDAAYHTLLVVVLMDIGADAMSVDTVEEGVSGLGLGTRPLIGICGQRPVTGHGNRSRGLAAWGFFLSRWWSPVIAGVSPPVIAGVSSPVIAGVAAKDLALRVAGRRMLCRDEPRFGGFDLSEAADVYP